MAMNFKAQLVGPELEIPSLAHKFEDRPPILPTLPQANTQPQVNQNIAIDPSGGITYFQTPKKQSSIGDFKRRYGSKDEQSDPNLQR